MNAVISIGGRQYTVKEGDNILVQKINKQAGEEITIDKVLMLKRDKETLIGRPLVEGAAVNAKVIAQTRGPKITVFKKRSKMGYKKTIGHRQDLTQLFIEKIKVR